MELNFQFICLNISKKS